MQFDFHDMPICSDDGLTDETEVCDVEVEMRMDEPADKGIAPSLNHPGEPPWPATYVIEEIRLVHRKDDRLGHHVTTLKLTEEEFTTFFAPAADIINNAFEWASEQED